jgi:hypothetical protein
VSRERGGEGRRDGRNLEVLLEGGGLDTQVIESGEEDLHRGRAAIRCLDFNMTIKDQWMRHPIA